MCSGLERFRAASNDFNCSMRLNDSDGNVFTTSFTPGVIKVIDFLKSGNLCMDKLFGQPHPASMENLFLKCRSIWIGTQWSK
jgi:hypothetical protein